MINTNHEHQFALRVNRYADIVQRMWNFFTFSQKFAKV